MNTQLYDQYAGIQIDAALQFGVDFDDAVQDAALWFITRGDTVDLKNGPQSYIRRAAVNRCITNATRERRRVELEVKACKMDTAFDVADAPVEDAVIARVDVSAVVTSSTERDVLHALLFQDDVLSEIVKARMATAAKPRAGVTTADIAERLRVSRRTVERIVKKFVAIC